MGIPRGTTPTIVLTFSDDNLDLTEAEHVVVSFRGGVTIEKADDELEISAKMISVFLSQSETLTLAKGEIAVQVNWTYSDGKRAASNIAGFRLTENLVGRVIE